MDYTYSGKEDANTLKHLQAGETCKVTGYGQSMAPRLKSGQSVIVEPVTAETVLKKRDIVFVKVNGHIYLHLISAIKNNKQFQISNNHKHVNGWVSRSSIYGKVVKIL